jgi:hypothetical protein
MQDDVRQGLSAAVEGVALGVAMIAAFLLVVWWFLAL